MAYNEKLADRVREYLCNFPDLKITEIGMFSGWAFLVNDKMCINITKDRLMCRVDPSFTEVFAERLGYEPMIMRGKSLPGFCLVLPEGYQSHADFNFWMQACLAYNPFAKPAKKKNKSQK